MKQEDILNLFFSRAYEMQLNMNILNDVDYIIPVDGILNYVCEVIGVPYTAYIEYIKSNPICKQYNSENITQSSSFGACEHEMVSKLIHEDNSGFTYSGIGELFSEYVTKHNDVNFRKYGENQVKTASQLGLTYSYFKYWYLNCIGYIYNELDSEDKVSLLARNILRDPLYNLIIRDILTKDIDLVSYMDCIESLETKYRRYDSVLRLVNICLEECDNCGIKHYNVLNTKKKLSDQIKQRKTKKEGKNNKETKIEHSKITEDLELPFAADKVNSIEYYLQKFADLHCYKKNKVKAPYKAIMLISIMNLIEKGIINSNHITATKELKEEFVVVASDYRYDRTLFNPTFDNPFIHLSGDGFWHIKRNSVKYDETQLPINKVSEINHVYLDDELYMYMCNSIKRECLKRILIEHYFDKD